MSLSNQKEEEEDLLENLYIKRLWLLTFPYLLKGGEKQKNAWGICCASQTSANALLKQHIPSQFAQS
jgi:hypothetical protein